MDESKDPTLISKVKKLIEAVQTARKAIEKSPIIATVDGVWINVRVKGSAMWGLQNAEKPIIESFKLMAELNREALSKIDEALKQFESSEEGEK